jgi:hypothetical protein
MKRIISLGLILISFSSCYHVYYSPNTPNAPQLTEKGETRINGLYVSGGDSEFEGGEIQVAHAVSDKVGLMLNGFFAGKEEANEDDLMENGKGSYFEFAAGSFKTMGNNDRLVADLYLGVGLGSVKSDYARGDISRVNVTKFFLQPSLGYKSNHFEFAVVPRIGVVNWNVKENKITTPENSGHKDEMDHINRNPNFFVFEPALIVRGGAENFKLQASLCYSANKNTDIVNEGGIAESLVASLGISFSIHPSGKGKKLGDRR